MVGEKRPRAEKRLDRQEFRSFVEGSGAFGTFRIGDADTLNDLGHHRAVVLQELVWLYGAGMNIQIHFRKPAPFTSMNDEGVIVFVKILARFDGVEFCQRGAEESVHTNRLSLEIALLEFARVMARPAGAETVFGAERIERCVDLVRLVVALHRRID